VAQGARISGEVLRIQATDTIPVPGRWVILHAVTLTTGGPIDSQRTDGAGRYALRVAAPDTLANYLVSVEHQGIGYFSPPIRPESLRVGRLDPLFVYDTSSSAPMVTLQELHVLVEAPTAEGGRRVVQLFVLANRGSLTRVARDSTGATWQGAIPSTAQGFELGLSDFSPDAVEIDGDTLRVFAPIPPGERQILAGYLLNPGIAALVVPIDQPIGRVSILLGDSAATVAGASVPLLGVEELGGTPLRRFGADSVAAGTPVSIRFPRRPRPAGSLLVWLLVPLTAAAMVVVILVWRRRSAGAPVASADPATLAAEIAALDAAWKGSEDAEYRRRRAELMQRLEAALASRGPAQ
jgi:hypothetical protein